MQLRVTQRRARRALLHLGAVTTLAGTAVLLTGAPSRADDTTPPGVWQGDATASAIHFQTDRDPQLTPVTDAFHLEIPYATTELDSSGGSSATSASLYPGPGVTGLGGLLCQFTKPNGFCLTIPAWPFLAQASYPTAPDASSKYSNDPLAEGPATITPGTTDAHARALSAEARSEAAGLDLPGAFTVDSALSHSSQVLQGSTLVVTAESVLKGIDIGGELHIDALRSVAVTHVDGRKVMTASASTTLTGATVHGYPVTIDSTGIHVAGSGDGGAALGAVDTALAQLAAAGIDVRMLVPTRSAKDGATNASTGGLLLGFTHDVEVNLPVKPPNPKLPPPAPIIPSVSYNGNYFGTVTLAGAGVDAYAVPPFEFPSFVPPPFPQVPQEQPIPLDQPVTSPVLSGTTTGAVQQQQGGPPPTVVGSGPRTRTVSLGLLGATLSDSRLKLLALVLLGYPVLVLLLSPLRARPRRRRPRENVPLV